MSLTEQLQDEFRIRSLIIQERYYRDSQNWDKLRQCYHPDASSTKIDISWFTGNIDGFVQGSTAMAKSGTASSHTIQPVEIRINNGKALAISTGSVFIRVDIEGVEYDMVSSVRFVSEVAQVIGSSRVEWKLLSLECIYDRDSIATTRPMKDVPLEIQLSPDARTSYKNLEWLLTRLGFTINKHLPGTDDENSVRELLERHEKWLGS